MEGIQEAKKRKIYFGRVKLQIPKEFEKIVEKWSRKEISLRMELKNLM